MKTVARESPPRYDYPFIFSEKLVIDGGGPGGSWSAERFLKMAWSLERRPQKGLERGAPKFPFLVGAPKFSKTCRSISKEKKKKRIFERVESGKYMLRWWSVEPRNEK